MKMRRSLAVLCVVLLMAGLLTGCGSSQDNKRIVRIGHNQSTNHPSHIALEAFADFINEELGDKYVVEVYPSELLGSQTEMVQLTQTGAIRHSLSVTDIRPRLKTIIFLENASITL